MQVGRNRARHHDRTRGAEPLEKAHRDEGLDVGRKNRTRRRERKDREARRERTKGGEKRQEDDQKGTGVSRRASS